MIIILLLASILLSGCMNVTTRTMPEDTTVQPTHEGSDCVPYILGIMIGTATIEKAMANASSYTDIKKDPLAPAPIKPIMKVRRVQTSGYAFLMFGAQCVEVVGEASGQPDNVPPKAPMGKPTF